MSTHTLGGTVAQPDLGAAAHRLGYATSVRARLRRRRSQPLRVWRRRRSMRVWRRGTIDASTARSSTAMRRRPRGSGDSHHWRGRPWPVRRSSRLRGRRPARRRPPTRFGRRAVPPTSRRDDPFRPAAGSAAWHLQLRNRLAGRAGRGLGARPRVPRPAQDAADRLIPAASAGGPDDRDGRDRSGSTGTATRALAFPHGRREEPPTRGRRPTWPTASPTSPRGRPRFHSHRSSNP